ncbi:PTS sugar transporter subunit IIB [Bacillus sp. 165]|uniref:PTS sugar transporter subunit IIB n=1 Tax=Bacillus sp. 165 TaxID=1529117 RepID=UPI001ADBF2A8|nr:PTS sugar transporter subunit IIB [Bacillus sp. 165]MBO9129964.1 PTS sugar transporter subunit IIB [Bacillus sp. 165]
MNILLCCAAGMSTSLLVSKMEQAAKEQGMQCKIWAVCGSEVREHIEQADVLLIGPQVRYLLKQMQELGKEKGVPVDVINTVHYGMCNGEAVLKTAVSMKR